jgi:hypothetical protein
MRLLTRQLAIKLELRGVTVVLVARGRESGNPMRAGEPVETIEYMCGLKYSYSHT